MTRVLVTGGSGFIGRPVVRELAARGHEVHVVGRAQCDLHDDQAVRRLMRDLAPSHLVHLAWDVTPGKFWSAAENLDWVAASLRLYRAFAAYGGKRALFAGSCAEYDWSHDLLDEATTPLRPATLYGAAKSALHDLVARAAAADGVSLAWARFFMLYGPDEYESRLVPSVARALLNGEPALCGDGQSERDFLHSADAARAIATVLDSEFTGAVNIASGECVKLAAMIGEIAAIIGRPDLVRLGARATPASEPPRLAAAVGILENLGFQPQYNLQSGLRQVVQWWRGKG